jgi:hypothetical protein
MKSTVMKTKFARFFAAVLLCAFAILPLRAQTNPVAETGTDYVTAASAGIVAGDSDEVKIRKIEAQKDLDSNRLDYERHVAEDQLDSRREIIHDLAWNSWILAVLGLVAAGHLRNKMTHQTIRTMIEKGEPVTPELVVALKSKNRQRGAHDPCGYLAWALILAAVGGGLLLISERAGWIVLLVGVAELILWLVERAFSSSAQPK